jgi:undecaprenyl-diphosphatase
VDPATARGAPPAADPVATPANDPVVAQRSPAGWRIWLTSLLRHGKDRLAALGLALGLGLGAALLALWVFAALADEVMEQDTAQLDNAVLAALRAHQSPLLDSLAWFGSMLGAELLAVFALVLVAALGWQRRWGAVVGLLLTVVGAQLLNDVLKDWFHRTRPAPVGALIPAQAFSFPSGHAMVAAAFYLFVGYLAWRLIAGRWRIVCAAVLVLVAFLIGLSRLYLGVHYLTDVAAGYIAGIAWTDAVIVAGHVLVRRNRRAGPLRPASAPGDALERARPVESASGPAQAGARRQNGALPT